MVNGSDDAGVVTQGILTMTCAPQRRPPEATTGRGTLRLTIKQAKREAVERVLAQTRGNVAAAAAVLGIVRTSLYRIMKRYGIASPTRPQSRD